MSVLVPRANTSSTCPTADCKRYHDGLCCLWSISTKVTYSVNGDGGYVAEVSYTGEAQVLQDFAMVKMLIMITVLFVFDGNIILSIHRSQLAAMEGSKHWTSPFSSPCNWDQLQPNHISLVFSNFFISYLISIMIKKRSHPLPKKKHFFLKVGG